MQIEIQKQRNVFQKKTIVFQKQGAHGIALEGIEP